MGRFSFPFKFMPVSGLIRLPFPALISALLAFSCAATQKEAPLFQRIEFGSGGGFTGRTTTYVLSADGSLHTKKEAPGGDSLELLGAAGEEAFKEISELVTTGGILDLALNAPHNMYRFVTVVRTEGEVKLVWGDPAVPVPENLKMLFEKLTGLVKKARREPGLSPPGEPPPGLSPPAP